MSQTERKYENIKSQGAIHSNDYNAQTTEGNNSTAHGTIAKRDGIDSSGML